MYDKEVISRKIIEDASAQAQNILLKANQKAEQTIAEAKARYKHEATLAKQEIAAARAQTKSLEHQHKSAVTATKADITRIKAEQ